MQRKFDIYDDPGHGWLKVPVSLLGRLGIAGKITSYSYLRGKFAYLEEDCDARTFLEAYRAKFDIDPKFSFHPSNKRSKIRSYKSFDPKFLVDC